jgi:hypothetical protein
MTFNPNKLGLGVLILLLPFWATGCGTVPSRHDHVPIGVRDAEAKVLVLPAPIRTFPPVKPGLIRLPIVVTFPQGGGAFQRITNLVKGGITHTLQETYIKSRLKALWLKMESPLRMDDQLWLLIRPTSLSVGKARTDLKKASTLHAVVEMAASPEILFGPMPSATPVEMPRLQPYQPGPGIFQAMTNTHINYEDANRYFRDPRMGIIGKVLPSTGDRKLTIKGIRVYGSGGKVIVEAKVVYNPLIVNLSSKPAELTLYLRGTPRYLRKRRVFDMPDLEYDIKSSDLMIQVADFIFKSDFKDQLRLIAIVPVGAKMDILKAKMNKYLNRALDRDTHVRTQVNSFEVLDGYADNEGLEVQVSLKGTATLEIVWR